MKFEIRFLLVCLQLIIVLLAMSVNAEGFREGSRRVHHRHHHFESKSVEKVAMPLALKPSLNSPTPVLRLYRLSNLRSKFDLLLDKHISATAKKNDKRGEIRLESFMEHTIVKTRIRGNRTNKYLCFNQTGHLVSRKRAQGLKCEFIERVDISGYSEFSSAYNSNWMLGFDSSGKALIGPETKEWDCPDCYKFRKDQSRSNKHFDTDRHNAAIGQTHPGLNSNFLANFPFHLSPPNKKSSSLSNLFSSFSTTRPDTTKFHHPKRHRHKGRKNKKHRHGHGYFE